ncbi:MAG: GNAT family N-acetyltransferase, partial [Hyphomicrobiales bacterium]
WMLVLDGKPVAALFALVSGHEAMLGKIAYDEGFSRYSPGVLVLLDATQCLFADEAVRFADGNAIPGHPMIDRIWRDRMECMDVVIAGPGVSSAAFRTVAGWHGTKDASRAVIKRFYLRATGRKTS